MTRTWPYLAASALAVVLAASCAALAQVMSTTELHVRKGSGESDGSFRGSQQQGGWSGAPGSFNGTTEGDSDYLEVGVSIRPLAFMEPPREVVVVNAMPPEVPRVLSTMTYPRGSAVAAPELARPASGCGPDQQVPCRERTWHCAGCARVVTDAGGSAGHVCEPPAQPDVRVVARAPHGVTITLDGEPAVDLDPLEPFKGPPPVAEPPPASSPPAKSEPPAPAAEKPVIPPEMWGAVTALILAVAGWIGHREWKKRRPARTTAAAPKAGKESA